MNSIIQNYYGVFEMYQALRNQLMDLLVDDDLGFSPGGDNPSLGALCQELGEVEYAYIQSFKTLTQDFSYRNDAPGLADSVAKLSAWYADLDGQLKATVEGLSEEDVQNKVIHRGPNFDLPPQIQLDVYKEALLIFYGKVAVYLRVMGKPLPKQWQEWLG